jgi:hypothetical protein|tara:strand:- start:739 stop:1314 length:576 start_codon:yes stop_codon:yes gene_type:complete
MQKDNIEENILGVNSPLPGEEVKEATESRYFQWIKGDDTGRVVTIKDIDDQWINFNEGGRLAKDLKDEFIKSLDEDIAKEFIKTETPKITLTPPKNIQKITGDVLIPNKEISPIRVLFNKQKKNNKVKLILEFPVNIPAKGVYELMSTSFDPTEVNEQLESFILDQLSEDEILDCLHNSVKSLIESKYKGE